MQTPAFRAALDDLIAFATTGATAIMCAEAVWWRCHRNLVSDALVVRGVEVAHITSTAAPSTHRLNPMARVEDGRITYPAGG